MTELEKLQKEISKLKIRVCDLETDNRKSFRKLSSFFTDEGKDLYIVIARYGTYTLIYRGTKFEPLIVAWLYNPEKKYWEQGHYFDKFADAIKYLFENEPVLQDVFRKEEHDE